MIGYSRTEPIEDLTKSLLPLFLKARRTLGEVSVKNQRGTELALTPLLVLRFSKKI